MNVACALCACDETRPWSIAKTCSHAVSAHAVDFEHVETKLETSRGGSLATVNPPPPPNTIKTANEGRFRLNVDSPYGERAQSTVLTDHSRPSAAPGAAAPEFHFQLEHARVEGKPRRRLFTTPEEEGAFDSVSAHLLATAANIFGWAGDPTK